jgi:two-component system nitrogen regulation response regulator GlnG
VLLPITTNNNKTSIPVLAATKGVDIIGESPAMQEVFRAIGRLSHSHITVLINGESGTGKELVAHALTSSFTAYQSSFYCLKYGRDS